MRRRNGFTITELLVAMALIIFIMYILAEAFAAGSTAFRNLKAVGDMNEKLRTVSQILRKYLSADHFDGKRRLSDPNFWQNGPPQEGFFRIYQGVLTNGASVLAPMHADYCSTIEGLDLDGNPSYRSTTHALHFAVKLRGNNRGDFFRAQVPAGSPLLLMPQPDTRFQDTASGIFTSQWGEVAIFLLTDPNRASPDVTDDPNNPGASLPLYTLYLRQRPLVTDNADVTAQNGGAPLSYNFYANYAQMSCYQDVNTQGNLYFNNPVDITMPARRMGASSFGICPGGQQGAQQDLAGQANPGQMYPTLGDEGTLIPPVKGLYRGDDILMTNVLSFDVRILLPFNQWMNYYNNVPNILPNTVPMYDFVSLGTRHPSDLNFNNTVVQQFSGTYYNPNPPTPIYIRPNNPYFTQFADNNQPPPGLAFTPNVYAPPSPWPGFYGYVFDTWSSRKDDGTNFDYSGWATAQSPVPYPAPPAPFTLGPQQSLPLYKNYQGMAIQVLAIQITIRIYDPNTKQTRQTSIVVDM